MHVFRWVFAAVSISAAWTAPPPSEYAQRRAELRKALPGAVTVLLGNTEKEHGNLRTGFVQEPNFNYLTGWTEPGAALLLTPDREIFFVPKRRPEEEKWTGPKTGPDDPEVRSRTGIDTVFATESLEAELGRALQEHAKLFALTAQPSSEHLKQLAPLREIGNAGPAIAKLRMVKSGAEIQLIQRATDITMEAHRAAWKRIAPGLYEYQVATAITSAYLNKGCERSAYAPIVGSGVNSTVLHYSENRRRMDAGDVLLMDVGAECAGYATDITRTVPVSGKFTGRQREIYDIVLGAQKAAIAAVKPGATLSKEAPDSIYKAAFDYINSHGKDKHGQPLGKYFTHGVGHHLGLEVHDANDPSIPLNEGMVITVEPGIYIPEEGIGIRIEDVVLVTKDGAKVLSASLPREAEEIERALAR